MNKKIEELAHKIDSPITTICSIDPIRGMSILSEISDINMFSYSSKLVYFAATIRFLPRRYSSIVFLMLYLIVFFYQYSL